MFGLGFWEIAIIVLAAFVFIRPDDLPDFLRNVGKLYKSLMELYRDMTSMAKNVDSELRHPLSLLESDEPVEQEPEKPSGSSAKKSTTAEVRDKTEEKPQG